MTNRQRSPPKGAFVLLIVSFALVLLATGLLVFGLLADDGLGLIYVSIAFSFAAAMVLLFAYRLSKPKPEPASAPEPLPEPVDAAPATAEAPTPAPAPVAAAVAPAAAAPDVTEALPVVPAEAAAVPAPAPEVEPAPAAPVAAEPGWADETVAWDDDEELEFPIADYDELKVAEIMPLLPQLYSDELDVVAEREQSGKNRSTILRRIDELREGGTVDNPIDDEVAPAAAVEAPVPAAVAIDDDDHEDDGAWAADDDDEWFFPIADYDELTVGQITPLLPLLEADELEDVRERELATSARKSVLIEIDRLLGGDATDDPTPAPAPAPARTATPAPAPAAGLEQVAALNVADIRPILADLDDDQLAELREIELAGSKRVTVLNDIEHRLGLDETPAPRRSTRKAAPRKASGRASTAKKSTAKKSTKKSTAKKSTAKKSAAKKSTKRATKKKASTRFPIGGYDELTVAEIRPRLTSLSDRQLRLVRDREAKGAARKTILDDIDNRLS